MNTNIDILTMNINIDILTMKMRNTAYLGRNKKCEPTVKRKLAAMYTRKSGRASPSARYVSHSRLTRLKGICSKICYFVNSTTTVVKRKKIYVHICSLSVTMQQQYGRKFWTGLVYLQGRIH